MDERDLFELQGGRAGDEAGKLAEESAALAERTGVSLEEAAAAISRAIQALWDYVSSAFDSLTTAINELGEEQAAPGIEPRARRRKEARSRARFIEQRYRAEIRRAEGERWYRRIYKPP